jgi:hypothetical protein
MCQPVGTWADTATARTWFALTSRRHLAVTSGDFRPVSCSPEFRISSNICIGRTGMIQRLRIWIAYADTADQSKERAAMAQKVQTLYVDDLDGSEADGTIRFGLDGTEYEIDLNANHTRGIERRPRALHGRWPTRPRQHQPAIPQRT